jgi:hypothetical protein
MEEVQNAAVFVGGISGRKCRVSDWVAYRHEIVVDALPKKIGGFIERFDVLLELLILGYLFMQEWSYLLSAHGAGKVTTLLRIPISIVYLVCR